MGAFVEGNNSNLANSDNSNNKDSKDDDQNIVIIPRNLKDIKIKIESFETIASIDHHDHDHDNHGSDDRIVDDDDGYKTPTAAEHRIPVDPPCPGAPRKPVAKRRRLTARDDHDGDDHKRLRFVEVSREEIELLFPPRSTMVNPHRPGNIKKVNKANLTTLTSFR